MFTDIVGYTSLTSKDDLAALHLVNKKNSVLKPLIKKHNGTPIKDMGDGTLSSFQSASDASLCAVEFQESVYEDDQMNVRVGIHYGDTIFKDNDVFGDVVNIASRIETMAVSGGVFISKDVFDQLSGEEKFDTVSLGLQTMKGVGRLVEILALKADKIVEPNPVEYNSTRISAHEDDEVPSLAIIPFVNKGKEEDIFYAYGISSDLIADVSGAGNLRVSGMNDVEIIDHVALSNTEIAEKLLVRYVATGSLWKMENMFQLSVELYDNKESKVIWSDRWQENWDSLPSIKGKLADGMLKVLDTPAPAGSDIITTVTDNADAYEFYLKGKYKYEKRKTIEDTEVARGLLKKAIQLDESLVSARNILGWTYDDAGDYKKALEIYRKSLSIAEREKDKHGIMVTYGSMGVVNLSMGSLENALELLEKQQAIAELLKDKYEFSASLGNMVFIYIQKADYDHAMDCLEKIMTVAEEIDHQGWIAITSGNMGLVRSRKGQYDRAMVHFNKQLEICDELDDKQGTANGLVNMGLIYKRKGDKKRALEYNDKYMQISKEIGNKEGIAIACGNSGSVYKQEGDFEKALELFDKGIALAKKIGFKHTLPFILLDKAETLYLSESFEKAKSTNQECLQIAGEMKYEEQLFVSRVLSEKIDFALAVDDDKKMVPMNKLEAMLKEVKDEGRNAQLQYELWILKKALNIDGFSNHQREALKLYNRLYKKTPDFSHKQKIEELNKTK